VHDITDLETRSTPAVFVATTEFVDAANAQAKSLGMAPMRVFIPHPIQDRTDEELQALADACIDELVAALLV
jgi:hypothetical protein